MTGRIFILLCILSPRMVSVKLDRAAQAREATAPQFVDVTGQAGLTSSHAWASFPATTPGQKVAGGVATGDFDGDGHVDLYVVCGDTGKNLLFRNLGTGAFAEVGEAAGVALPEHASSGPLFFDQDGDGRLDLFVGGVDGHAPHLFRNRGDGRFEDVTAGSGLQFPTHTISATAADYDGDGRLDLFLSHWGAVAGGCHLWRNTGARFDCADEAAGLGQLVPGVVDRTFTANFVDLNGDGRPDLLLTADFGQSSVWLNRGEGKLVEVTGAAITDENGMGSAVADVDGDGHFDWFVSSVFDDDGTTEGDWGTTGNRLYRSLGDGSFMDITTAAGLRDGNWGWGASFADFDNDGRLDLIQVNGWPQGSAQFRDVPARLFMATAAGGFTDRAVALGLDERGDNRGVAAFDFDEDGDLDIFVANNGGPHHLWQNQGPTGAHLPITVTGTAPNPFAVGALVIVQAGGREQRQLIRAGSNYVSQDPQPLHFGLGAASRADRVRVIWPDGRERTIEDVPANRRLHVSPVAAESGGGCGG